MSLFWLLATLLPLLFLQRRLHREIVSVFFLLTRQLNAALAIFSIIFFPGVLLHELSHWVMARVLGVRTGKVSLIPERTAEGALRMGFVETQRSDLLRETMIGAAPLLAGGVFVGFAGFARLGLDRVWADVVTPGGLTPAGGLAAVYDSPDFWLWFYLIFVVSSMMLPSESDRRAWLPVAGFGGILLLVALVAGAGDWMAAHLAPSIDRAISAAAIVFVISSLVHLLLLVPTLMLRRVLNRVTGLRVV
ncbi:MAG TPA: hypothetical protein VMN57_07550 [Anaerolineales bacterium]|nr:hypothetical protein [Anaerolineales bacterium]